MTQKALIYGAGAIGRGFLGPLLHRHGIEVHFVDIVPELVARMRDRGVYHAAITAEAGYQIDRVPLSGAYLLGQEPNAGLFDLVFSCVGVNGCYDLAERFKTAKAVFSCENDSATVAGLRELSGNERIYFGIPDVITSNTAPEELLRQDPLMTVSERGVLVLERGDYRLAADIAQVDKVELDMHWMCKFFIHNAPHAVTAYLGWLRGCEFIHEAMAEPDIDAVVTGSIREITAGVAAAGYATAEFARMYMEKELGRFRNRLLFDTVRRVARQPIRKLGRDNRLVLGLRLALFNGVMPECTAMGAKAALVYDNPEDQESVYLQSLRRISGDQETLREISGISVLDPLGRFVVSRDISRFSG
jgi:mannitol-1-phosphate/altronate dehydrogenase